MSLTGDERAKQNERNRLVWGKQADSYDRMIGWWERRFFGHHRSWACGRADGKVLEVAVGTGLNLPFYDAGLDVVGIDLSPEMIAIGRIRALEAGRDVDLKVGDAHHLEFADGTFDTVVATYALCNIPDPDQALGEMHRVLRSGGRLVMVDHIGSSSKPILWFQKLVEPLSIRLGGDHLTRRPSLGVEQHGFEITERARFARGVVERLVATKTP